MGDIDNSVEFMLEVERAGAEMLQLAALELQQQTTSDLRSGSNPPPYITPAPKGSFPHVRTGFLASSILYAPKSVKQIASTGFVRIGYAAAAFYGIALGHRGWKWLEDSLNAAMPRIQGRLDGFTIKGP